MLRQAFWLDKESLCTHRVVGVAGLGLVRCATALVRCVVKTGGAGCGGVKGRPRASSAPQRGRCKPGTGRNGKLHRISRGPATAEKERKPDVTMASPPEEDAIRAVYRPATERCQQADPRL